MSIKDDWIVYPLKRIIYVYQGMSIYSLISAVYAFSKTLFHFLHPHIPKILFLSTPKQGVLLHPTILLHKNLVQHDILVRTKEEIFNAPSTNNIMPYDMNNQSDLFSCVWHDISGRVNCTRFTEDFLLR